MTPLIRCGFGIGNRVATMANALSRDGSIQYSWKVNHHLPLPHSEVFPRGIPGVEFVDAPAGFATRWSRAVSGQAWDAAQDREAANTAYRTIVSAMVMCPSDPVEVAIMARFHRFANTSPRELALLASQHGQRAFLLVDSRRSEMAAELENLGVEVVLPNSPEMAFDKDRSKASMLQYLGDWQRALASQAIITTKELSSSVFPAMAEGRAILVHASGFSL